MNCLYRKTGRLFKSLPVLCHKVDCLEDMTETKDNEANDRDKEGKVFDAFYGISIVQWDVDDAWNITCQKRDRHGDIEQDDHE